MKLFAKLQKSIFYLTFRNNLSFTLYQSLLPFFAGHPLQENQDNRHRIARTGRPGRDKQDTIVKTWQQGQHSGDKRAGGQLSGIGQQDSALFIFLCQIQYKFVVFSCCIFSSFGTTTFLDCRFHKRSTVNCSEFTSVWSRSFPVFRVVFFPEFHGILHAEFCVFKSFQRK